MPQANQVPGIFVSPEDVVWQEPTNLNYHVAFTGAPGTPVGPPSPIVPDLSITTTPSNAPTNDWRFSWMVTAQQTTNSSNGAAFEGNIVIFENRQFAYDTSTGQAAGENVVEAIFGPASNPSGTVPASGLVQAPNVPNPPGPAYYAVGANRTVLLRWPGATVAAIPNSPQPDPVVKVGDWIADVTYERAQNQVNSRFYLGAPGPAGAQNPLNNLEWDNLPAQRCFWYQVQKVTPAQLDPQLGAQGYRSMVVYVNRSLEAKTALDSNGNPLTQNAALVCPNVVNVVPQTFFVR
jgi:hypothetical protein